MKNILLALTILVIVSCSSKSEQKDYNSIFNQYSKKFVLEWWKKHPVWAMYSGYYNYDSILPIQTESKRTELLSFYKSKLNELHLIEPDSLSSSNYTDYRIIENQLNSSTWYLKEFKSYEWDPSSYNVGGSLALIINGNYADKESRYNSIFVKLKNVPEFYMNAKRSLKSPTLEHTDLAIKQNRGALEVLSEALNDSISDLTWNEAKKAEFQMSLKKAQQSIDNYLMFLEEKKLQLEENPKRKSFRIGKELFSKKFEYDIVSSFTAEEIYSDALRMKKELHSKMYDLSVQLWEDYGEGELSSDTLKMIRAVIDNLSLEHCHRDSFITTIRQQIPQLVNFVKKKDLMYLDPEKTLVVRETPVYMRGVAGASISAPGPYEPKGSTYYNVTPLDHYSEDEAESYLREYNSNMLQILNIHEAIPGHYTQLVYSNKAPSMIKSLFGNGAMIEGWAVYTERMMLEEGYGNNSPEMWLMYYKWNLRTVCNTILDYSVHGKDLEKTEAMDLLINQAFQQQTEAEGKWYRSQVSQVQLCSYYTGYREIYQLRDEYKSMKNDFSLKRFHEEFLSYGSSPVKYIKTLMGF